MLLFVKHEKPSQNAPALPAGYKYRDGQRPITFFEDAKKLTAFTLLCVKQGTKMAWELRALIDQAIKTGKLLTGRR